MKYSPLPSSPNGWKLLVPGWQRNIEMIATHQSPIRISHPTIELEDIPQYMTKEFPPLPLSLCLSFCLSVALSLYLSPESAKQSQAYTTSWIVITIWDWCHSCCHDVATSFQFKSKASANNQQQQKNESSLSAQRMQTSSQQPLIGNRIVSHRIELKNTIIVGGKSNWCTPTTETDW